jgi:4-hydroxy-4-methyl-2-oxoglutarate aldolase
MLLNDREAIIAMTPENPYDRFPDGRPRVPDDLLGRMRLVTLEEAWGVLRRHGYNYQFVGDWLAIHPDRVLVGRAVTAAFMPLRPDLNAVVNAWGAARGAIGGQNSWVIDTLVKDDVIVVDLFGKVRDGTFAGDNLGNSIAAKTGTGMIIEGGIRDLARLVEIPDFAIFVRGVDPTAIRDVTMVSVNGPLRIDQATVLPGDVVLGTRGGIIFIPPHLAEEVVTRSEEVRLRDQFGHQRLREGRYTPGEIDTSSWPEHIEADFQSWRAERGN